MLAWVVINRQQPRQFTTKSSSPCTLCLCVKLSDSFPPTPVVSTAYGHPSTTAAPQLLCNHTLEHFFALSKISTPLFSIDSALFAQNTRGWGTHLLGSMWPRGIASKVE